MDDLALCTLWNIAFYKILVQSCLPILQYDATLSGHYGNRQMNQEMISFNLRLISTFPYKGAFFVRFKHRTGFMYRTITADDNLNQLNILESLCCDCDNFECFCCSSNSSFQPPVNHHNNSEDSNMNLNKSKDTISDSNLTVCHENRFNALQSTHVSCNCFIENDVITNDFLTNAFEASLSHSDLRTINIDQSQNSETSLNNFTNVTFCDDSQNRLIPQACFSVSGNNEIVSNKSNPSSNDSKNVCSIKLDSKGINIGHLNVQGICGDKMAKFSEIKLLLTDPVNSKLHVFGMSETKLKEHKLNEVFKIPGYQLPFRKDNKTNGGGGIIVYVRDGILAKRRKD